MRRSPGGCSVHSMPCAASTTSSEPCRTRGATSVCSSSATPCSAPSSAMRHRAGRRGEPTTPAGAARSRSRRAPRRPRWRCAPRAPWGRTTRGSTFCPDPTGGCTFSRSMPSRAGTDSSMRQGWTSRARPAAERPMSALAAEFVATAAQLACLLEVSAPKPGNVSPDRPFRDLRYEDFLASAAAIGPGLARAAERPLGPTILAAVESTAGWTSSNTNLGIVLLFAPLARAALADAAGSLRERVASVLAATTVADARAAYAAIRLAGPGGLGRVPEQDVRDEPAVTLLEAMRLAADRDAVAREYATGFEITFGIGCPAVVRARGAGLGWDDAVVETYLTLLSARPDSLIARKVGGAAAAEVSRAAAAAVEAGGVRTPAGRARIAALDATLRDSENRLNPGTTADLTAAALFVALLEGGWREGRAGALSSRP